MRIAVSDYDGTIATHGGLIGDVVGAVKRWREAGNAFGLATGRDLPMTLTETEKWGIPYDFLICVNGAALYDAPARLASAHLMPDGLAEELMRHPAGMASMHYQLSGTGELHVLTREGSWFPELGIPYTDVTFTEALALRELSQVSFAYDSGEECAKWSDALERDFAGRIAAHPNWTTIDINVTGIDKAAGIDEILRLRGWQDCEVRTIGDGGNDTGMIAKFGGYTVPDAHPAAAKVAKAVLADVPAMLVPDCPEGLAATGGGASPRSGQSPFPSKP